MRQSARAGANAGHIISAISCLQALAFRISKLPSGPETRTVLGHQDSDRQVVAPTSVLAQAAGTLENPSQVEITSGESFFAGFQKFRSEFGEGLLQSEDLQSTLPVTWSY